MAASSNEKYSAKNGIYAVWLVCAGLFIVLSLLTNNSSEDTNLTDLRADNEHSSDITPTTIVRQSSQSVGFRDRYIGYDDIFVDGHPYPSSIIDTPLDQLIGLRCSTFYTTLTNHESGAKFTQLNPYAVSDTAVESVSPDMVIHQAIEKLDQLTSQRNEVNGAMYCRTITGDSLYVLHTGLAASSGLTRVFFVYEHNKNDRIIGQIEQLVDELPSFSCAKPIQLTTNGTLTWQCDGGNQDRSSIFLYQIKLDNNNATVVASCVTSASGESKETISDCTGLE
ncbi:hypothetical protein HGA91_04005 [candidate division WWE3 bacterium]|nr:hypothetical protein [candidate division WWE3 bacterium]